MTTYFTVKDETKSNKYMNSFGLYRKYPSNELFDKAQAIHKDAQFAYWIGDLAYFTTQETDANPSPTLK